MKAGKKPARVRVEVISATYYGDRLKANTLQEPGWLADRPCPPNWPPNRQTARQLSLPTGRYPALSRILHLPDERATHVHWL